MNKCCVRLVTFSNGERYPLLIDSYGLPLWYPTLFVTTQIRNVSKTPNTMMAILSTLRVLMTWSDAHELDLESRFAERLFLNEQEIESLCRFAQCKQNEDQTQKAAIAIGKKRYESVRGIAQTTESRVSNTTQYIRLSYIADYLEWSATHIVESNAKQVDSITLERIKRMIQSIRSRRSIKTRNSTLFARKGLTKSQQETLLELVRRESNTNPFTPKLQGRNQLIVLLLFYLGLRAGELLSLRVSDFDLQQNTLLIARRHDNPSDPRAYQPVVKTADRRIPLADSLVRAVSDYILKERIKFTGSKRHHFLFITHQPGPFAGHPLSIKGLTKIFTEIQAAAPSELGKLTPHLLRHTANDRFSMLMDQKETSVAEEEKLRSYLMGWKEGSGTAAIYTRRHTETKAKEAALKLQNRNPKI